MKIKILIFTIITPLFLSCKSDQQKALELIDKYMFDSLYDYSSYEVISTEIDSAFTTIYQDSIIQNYALTIKILKEKAKEYSRDYDHAKDLMDIYSGGYSLSWSKYYTDAKRALDNYTFCIESWNDASDSIKYYSNNFIPQHIGWNAKHRFRTKSKGGNFAIGNYNFIMDDSFKEISAVLDTDDELLIEIQEIVDNSLNKE